MSRRLLSSALIGFLVIIFINWSCTKLDTTNIGSDLLPDVDNINTFADTFSIIATQGVFEGSILQDSTKLSVKNPAENYALGKTTDPIFGGTEATLYLQIKPPFYPYYYGSPGDTITHLDSIVLCLAYKGSWGDTSIASPIRLQVFAVSPAPLQVAPNMWDSLGTYTTPSLRPVSYGPQIGEALSDEITISLDSVKNYKKIGKGRDSVINQIRVNLNANNATANLFRSGMGDNDTALGGIFTRDTLFRAFNNGFAIKMTQGNTLLYTQLNDLMTGLEIHYKRKNGAVTSDTSYSRFSYNNGIGGSAAPRRGAVANKITRDRSATPLPTPVPAGNSEIYLQTAPGTFATLSIPALTGYTNRIIHRAEIIMEQIPDPISDAYFTAPNYLYLDLVDTGAAYRWKPIYYDLNPSFVYQPDSKTGNFDYFPFNGEVDFSYFGAVPKTKSDASGTRKYYTINISRYVQQLVTDQTHSYDMRVFAPHTVLYPQYETTPTEIPYVNNVAYGRVRLGGGNHPNPDYRMRLRIIYSKLK